MTINPERFRGRRPGARRHRGLFKQMMEMVRLGRRRRWPRGVLFAVLALGQASYSVGRIVALDGGATL